MAEIRIGFRNVGAKKCAVSSPRIVSLEIGHESSDTISESVYHGYFLNEPVCLNGVKCKRNILCGCDKQSDKIFLNNSLSTSTCDERPSDKIKSANDIDITLLDLLNSTKLKEASELCEKNFNSKTIISDDKIKISKDEVSDDLSDILSSISHEIAKEGEVTATSKYWQKKSTQDFEIDLLDFDFSKKECVENSLSSNNSALKVEGNLSDILSSINIEDYNVSKVESCKSSITHKFNSEETPCVVDLSDLLSSIDLGNSYDNIGSYNGSKMCKTKVSEIVNESCLSDSLSPIDSNKLNRATLEEEPCGKNLCDLSSINNSNCSNGKFDIGNQINSTVMGTKEESCLADFLSSIDIDKSNHQPLPLLNNKPLYGSISDLYSKGNNGESDSLNDFNFDLSCSSSNSSCTSSYCETENNSPKSSLTEHDLTNKISESDSGYSSYDSTHKEFSFFDYSSDNQFSLNSLITKKLDVNLATKGDCEDAKEEMSMSDLLTIVSPEFKSPVLVTLNKTDKYDGSVNKDSSSIVDLVESLNFKSKDSNPNFVGNECDKKLMDYDCTDGQISQKVKIDVSTIGFQIGNSLENEDKLIGKNDILHNDKTASDDDQDFFVDLRECVKSVENRHLPTSPIRQDKRNETQHSECFSPNKILFHCEKKLSSDLSHKNSNLFEFSDDVTRKKIRINTKQTMFSKALACKPKNDPSLLQKVANIKKELLSNIIHRPVFIDCDVPQPIVQSVVQSDRCISSSIGRRYFGLDVPYELQ